MNAGGEISAYISTRQVSQGNADSSFKTNVHPSLEAIARALGDKPFRPHPLFVNGHAQTIAAHLWPRRFGLRAHRLDEERFFEVETGVSLLAHCRWQRDATTHPTLVLAHGLEGSSASVYMLGTADKAFRAGFNVVRLNHRNCGGTEHLTPTLYHSGMIGDMHAVIRELIERDHLSRIFLVGFSMSGNMVLRLAAEEAERLPRELIAVGAVSASVDLKASADAIERQTNRIYMRSFMKSLHRRLRHKQKLYPEIYDTSDLHLVRTIRDFDERFTAIHGGYANADDYYARASSLPVVKNISLPALVIHAQDDPFIPYQSLCDSAFDSNPQILLLTPQHGGHVGFIAAETSGEDRFWAENRIVQFCHLIDEGRKAGV